MPLTPPPSLIRPSIKAASYVTGLGANATAAYVLNACYFLPVFLVQRPYDRILFQVTTAGGPGALVRLGIYSDTDGEPVTLLTEAGTVDASTIGVKEITIAWTPPSAGLYWLAAAFQVSACSGYGFNTGSFLIGRQAFSDTGAGFHQLAVSGALPAATSGLSSGAAVYPRLGVRAA